MDRFDRAAEALAKDKFGWPDMVNAIAAALRSEHEGASKVVEAAKAIHPYLPELCRNSCCKDTDMNKAIDAFNAAIREYEEAT